MQSESVIHCAEDNVDALKDAKDAAEQYRNKEARFYLKKVDINKYNRIKCEDIRVTVEGQLSELQKKKDHEENKVSKYQEALKDLQVYPKVLLPGFATEEPPHYCNFCSGIMCSLIMIALQAEEKGKESEVAKGQKKYNQVLQAIKKLEQHNTTANEKQKHVQVQSACTLQQTTKMSCAACTETSTACLQKKMDTVSKALATKKNKLSDLEQQVTTDKEELPEAEERVQELQGDLDASATQLEEMQAAVQGEVGSTKLSVLPVPVKFFAEGVIMIFVSLCICPCMIWPLTCAAAFEYGYRSCSCGGRNLPGQSLNVLIAGHACR